MSDKPNPLKDELETALSAFEAPEELKAALRETFKTDMLEISLASDSDLEQQDSVQKSRLTYVVSILRFLAYLRAPFTSQAMREGQAKLALGYIRHAESANLQALQFGRGKTDSALQSEIEKLRKRLDVMSEHKAKILQRADEKTH